MKKEIADKWITALRSGEYRQGKRNLNDGNGNFCCLGVLCEIAIEENVHIDIKQNKKEFGINVVSYDGCDGMLPKSVKTWAGLESSFGDFNTKEFLPTLAHLNDSGATFKEIADLIEKKWNELR